MTEFQEAFAALARMAEHDEEIAEFLFRTLSWAHVSSEKGANFMHKFARAARQEGATTDKNFAGDFFDISIAFTSETDFRIFTSRESVCKAKVVGQETVEVPDYSAVPTKEVIRDVIEWECHPLLSVIDPD